MRQFVIDTLFKRQNSARLIFFVKFLRHFGGGNMYTTEDISKLNFSRVAVIGCPGSGKTTLSVQLQKILDLPLTHLDKVLWEPNWHMLDYEKRVEIHNELISCERWIIDGMWKSHLADRFKRATLIVFLDYKRRLCLSRALKRRIKYTGKQRADIADGCLEKLDGYFLKYIWTFRKNVRPLILQLMSQNPSVQTVTLKNPKETKRFLEVLSCAVTQ